MSLPTPTLADLRVRDRPHRRGDARAADRARAHHRPADRDQGASGRRLGVPAGARGLDDAGASPSVTAAGCRSTRSRASGASSSRPSPMSSRPKRACRRLARRRGDARFRALPFRLHRALRRRTWARRGDRRGGARRAGDLGMFALDGGPAPGAWWTRLAPPRRPRSSRACRSSSGRTIPRACRSS